MHDVVSRCHIDGASGHRFDPNVSQDTSLEGPALLVPSPRQWVSSTAGRAVEDPYSWMQAVHWVHGTGAHRRFNVTTVRLAQILAELNPCRPGVEYLMRRLALSERAVQYHLAALRETGLLAYISKGTRRRGALPQASVFTRTVPLAFDVALGIRCTHQGLTRRPVGIAEHGRKLIAKLGKKASRKVRAPRPKKARTAAARCTPMEGGSVLPSLTHSPTSVPLETSGGNRELATGETKNGSTPRRLNKIGRRFQLAAELKSRILWLSRPPVARIAWVIAEVSDAGWTADEVEAWLHLRPSADVITRPSGFLAARLVGAAVVWADPKARQRAVEASRESRISTSERHAESNAPLRPARSSSVMAAVLAGIGEGLARLSADCRAKGLDDLTGLPKPAATEQDDWDQAAAAMVALFGDQARTVLATATREHS
ncbi:hypothetical protein KCMC57_64520 (plasmid) [Kitasatospora sp. CMC57]|uniref:Transcriptional regulator n=1 Tax=Kitasatospora sp. CMC57 TaxID=3231513 RepID=A0AB33K8T9_9ACTN